MMSLRDFFRRFFAKIVVKEISGEKVNSDVIKQELKKDALDEISERIEKEKQKANHE